MSLDRSLKTHGSLVRHRNVLSRAERIAKLQEKDRFRDGDSVFGLPKVANRNVKVGKKAKAPKEEGAEGAAAGTAPAAAAAAPAAAAGKAPAGGKGAGKGAGKEGKK